MPSIAVCNSLVVWFLLVSGPLAARDIFVDNIAGDDSARGFAPRGPTRDDGPVRTIARALRLAEPADRIILAKTGAAYRESISLVGARHSGTFGARFIIQGNGATLDGSRPVPTSAWRHVKGSVFRFRPERVAHQQLFLDDRPLVRRPAEWHGSLPALLAGEWCLWRGDLYFCSEPGTLPQTLNLSYAGLQTGVTLYNTRQVTIDNLTVQGFQLDGISAPDGAADVRLISVTARGNGRSGISVAGSSRVAIEDSLLGDNAHAQLRVEAPARVTLADNELLDNTAPPVVYVP